MEILKLKVLKKINCLFFSLVLILQLVACVSDFDNTKVVNKIYLPNNDPTWVKHLDDLNKIKQYHIDGIIGYLSKNKRGSVNFSLDYTNIKNYQFALTSNYTSKAMYIKVNQGNITLINDKQQQQQIANIDDLVEQLIGIKIPIDKLVIWLKGQIDNSTKDYHVNQQGVLDNFNYSFDGLDWNIQYDTYQQIKQIYLPNNISINNQVNKLKLKINIKNWQL